MAAVVKERADGSVDVRAHFAAPKVVEDFIHDPAFVTGYFGPLGIAKSTALIMKAHAYGRAWPDAKVAIIRTTWPALEDTTLQTCFEWFPDGVCGHYHKTKKIYELGVGDGKTMELLFRSLEDQRDIEKVLSLQIAAAAVDEPQGGISPRKEGGIAVEPGLNRDLFLGILGRCGRQAGYRKMLWMGGNPPAPSHWIAKEFRYNPGASGHDQPTNPRPRWHLYLGTQDTNRENCPPHYYEDLLEAYGEGSPMARRFIEGEWMEWSAEQPFLLDWFHYSGTDDDPTPPASDLVIEAGVDPAISKNDRAARSAIVLAGQERKPRNLNRGRIHILHAVAGHWSVYETVDHLLKLVQQWKVRTVRIEDVAYQRGLGEVLDHEARQRGIMVNVELVKPDGDKLRRAHAWSALVQDGTVVFAPGLKPLVDAMVAVPMDATMWDLVDAAGICVRGFPLMQGESMRIPVDEPEAKRARGYSARSRTLETARPRRQLVVPANSSSEFRRAAGYAVGPRRVPVGAGR